MQMLGALSISGNQETDLRGAMVTATGGKRHSQQGPRSAIWNQLGVFRDM
jgi:hypothetical protein